MKADVDKLDNPVWPKPSQQARTELCAYGGNEICEAKGPKVFCLPALSNNLPAHKMPET